MLRTAAGVVFALLAVAAQPAVWGQTFTTFDPPGSQGTTPVSINPAGQITGSYTDASFATHGFVRTTDGTITSFDAPGADHGTFPALITPQGLIVGIYFDANYSTQPFLRAHDGTFTTFQIPSAGAFIYALVASSAGATAGAFFGSNGPQMFLRSPSGHFTLIDFPPAFLTFFFVPNVTAMTPGGTILGSYFDSNGTIHGFLRTIDGNFTTFDAPNAATGFFSGTTPSSISDSGIVSGFYNDSTRNSELRLFVRASNGVFSSFATPQPGNASGAASINPPGAVAGYVHNFVCAGFSCTDQLIGFLRDANGTVKQVNDPAAVQGTGATAINPTGTITGFYLDANSVAHGFVRTPN